MDAIGCVNTAKKNSNVANKSPFSIVKSAALYLLVGRASELRSVSTGPNLAVGPSMRSRIAELEFIIDTSVKMT